MAVVLFGDSVVECLALVYVHVSVADVLAH